jgi:hypothetical protein
MFKNDLNLAYITNLRTIKLNELDDETVWCLPAKDRFIPPMDSIFELLSRITSPHAEHVWLIFAMSAVSDLEKAGWSSIDHLLTRPRWASLQQLEIGLFGMLRSMPKVTEAIKLRLPMLESRGVVNVSPYYDIQRGGGGCASKRKVVLKDSHFASMYPSTTWQLLLYTWFYF